MIHFSVVFKKNDVGLVKMALRKIQWKAFDYTNCIYFLVQLNPNSNNALALEINS
jgi:hypothetical protein